MQLRKEGNKGKKKKKPANLKKKVKEK